MKPIHLIAFSQCAAGLQSFGQYRNPRDRTSKYYKRTEHWVPIARVLEAACFDAIFFADVQGAYDVYGGSADAGIRHAVQFPGNDPTMLFPAMAQVTYHLGFISTYSTTYYPPFHTAKLFSSLDHFTDGRVGWNIVTSYLNSAARNGHWARCSRTTSATIAPKNTWKSCTSSGRQAGKRMQLCAMARVTCILIQLRCIQSIITAGIMRWLVLTCANRRRNGPIAAAGRQSGRGIRFDARHGEAIFVTYPTIEAARPRVARIRAAAAAEGRNPDHIRILADIAVIVAESLKRLV